ncbi:MAG: M56 family metallopeptidase, partial [Anaerovoracaceae bacterium]
MNGILLELWKLTLQSALIITVILLIRSIFKGKINPKLQYALWLLPMMRLLIPFSIPSAASILNVFEPVTQRISTAVSITSSNASLFQQAEDTLSNVEIGNPADYSQIQASGFDWLALLLYVWIAGMAAVALYSFFVNIRFGLISKKSRQKVELPEKARDLLRGKGLNVYLCDSVYTPCLCGFFRPYILITKKALESEETLNMVLMHEYSHFKQHDNIYAFVRCLLCAIYWFNLFVWIAAAKSRQDCETACDTHVLKNFNSIKCQDYGMALINVIDRSKNMPEILKGVTTMSSSKKELKERISLIGHQPRMLKLTALVIAFIITAVTIVACTGTLENQADKPEPTPINILANTDETEDTLEPEATPLQAPKAERVFDRTKPEEIAEEFLTRYFEAAN